MSITYNPDDYRSLGRGFGQYLRDLDPDELKELKNPLTEEQYKYFLMFLFYKWIREKQIKILRPFTEMHLRIIFAFAHRIHDTRPSVFLTAHKTKRPELENDPEPTNEEWNRIDDVQKSYQAHTLMMLNDYVMS